MSSTSEPGVLVQPIKFSGTLTHVDIDRTRRPARRMLVWVAGLIVALSVCGRLVLGGLNWLDPWQALVGVAAMVAGGCLTSGLLALGLMLQSRLLLGRLPPRPMSGRFLADGIEVTRAAGSDRWQWSDFQDYGLTLDGEPLAWLLLPGRYLPIVLPRRLFETEDDWLRATDLLAEHVAVRKR